MLSPKQAQIFYDNFGKKQDYQFHERVPQKVLIRHGAFPTAESVFEFGCGTGRLAKTLLESHLSENARYRAIDISPVMVSLSQKRLSRFSEQTQIGCSDGSLTIQQPDSSIDRFVSTYVLELLDNHDITSLLDEAHRLLVDNGLLCLAVLSHGNTFVSNTVSKIWTRIHQFRPMLVGGCRPISIEDFLPAHMWQIKYSKTIVSLAVPSQVVIAEKI